MKYLFNILSVLLFLGLNTGVLRAESVPEAFRKRDVLADSIMDKVLFYAPFYSHIVENYQASVYVKGRVNIQKKNFLIRYLPSMFRVKEGVREYISETYSDLNFMAPDTYDQKVIGSVGTTSKFWEADGRLLDYFHVNIYASTLLADKLLSPLAPNARKYYKFHIDSVFGASHQLQYKIRFVPRYKNYQLVGGYMVVSEDVWSVREIRFSGRSEVFRFTNRLKMGEVGEPNEFLPVRNELEGSFRFLGNRLKGAYLVDVDYKKIQLREVAEMPEKPKKKKYDLSDMYTLRTDTSSYIKDVARFDSLRPIPLEAHEQELYESLSHSGDSLTKRDKRIIAWGRIEDALLDYNTISLKKMGSIRISPLINPFMLGFSAQNGFSYSQRFRYSRLFSGDRVLRVSPSIGYNFKSKSFYWQLNSDWEYYPRKGMVFHVEAGNGNKIYSSALLEDLKEMPDSVFDFDKFNLRYYKDLYLKLRHSWEIVNGLVLDVNLTMHRRTAEKDEDATQGGMPDVLNGRITRTFNSFAPGIRLSWTPGQYYYMDGARKVNLHSRFPSISVDWERGIQGVFPNSGKHERFEVELQHNIPLKFMRTLYYRLGWGCFTKYQNLYFVDYANFRRYNLPTGWGDDLGGIFQLLDRRWYNSSSEYVRGNITYESPFLMLGRISRLTQSILTERIYLGAVCLPHLKPYTEVGYGIGTHVFDFGLFAGFNNWKYTEFGVKITLELFSK